MKARKPIRSSEKMRTPAGRALERAALVARKIARMHGTPIYILRNGKVVAEKP